MIFEFKSKIEKVLYTTIIFFVCVCFASCMSLQKDVSITADQTKDTELVANLANRIAELDANWFEGDKKNYSSERKKIISIIDEKLAERYIEKSLQARFLALRGRLFFISGDITSAKRDYKEAVKYSSDDNEVIILGNRLDIKPLLPQQSSIENPTLMLEYALSQYKKNCFGEAVGLFDIAFLSLPKAYNVAYKNIRDECWNLKSVTTTNPQELKLLSLQKMTLSQMMEVAQISVDLNAYTASEPLSSQKLFSTLVRSGLLQSVSKLPKKAEKENLTANTLATRILCARFLWNLYSDFRGSNFSATQYSKEYRGQSDAQSPIPDVALESQDFDAVLGCVEHEFISLVDGELFEPEKTITAIEFRDSIKKIR